MQDPSVKSLKNNLKRLFDLTLIEQHEIGDDKVEAYYVAPLVRDFLQEANLLALGFKHKVAGDYFDKLIKVSENVEDGEEAYYHYYTAKDKVQVNLYGRMLCSHYFDNQIFRKSHDIGIQTEDFVGADTEGVILNSLGEMLIMNGQIDTALCYHERALNKYQINGNKHEEASTLFQKSKIYSITGDYKSALQYLEQSLAIMYQIKNQRGEAIVLNELAVIARKKNDYNDALAYSKQSLIIHQRIGDKEGEGRNLGNIGLFYSDKGNYKTALNYLKQSLIIQREIGDLHGECTTLNNLATLMVRKNDFKTASGYLERCFIINEQMGDIVGLACTLNNLGVIYWDHERDAKNALDHFIRAYYILKHHINSPDASKSGSYLNTIKATIGEAKFNAILVELGMS
jgi:tetratricopeptide (TPR) repeat protein